MKKKLAAGLVASALAVTTLGATAPAQAAHGTKSLASVLAAEGTRFDKNPRDYDITEAAVLAVLDAKPNSPVKILTQGSKKATAFIPSDVAFQRLVASLTGSRPATERATFNAVAGLGIDTVETVLLYHVIPNKTLNSPQVLAARGTRVKTAQGGTIRVTVKKGRVILGDLDRNAVNPTVSVLDINRGNRQVGHGINRVLRPLDL
ncbi:fasciclin domain-containing protein [Nocardioides nanhaiensis]|uniref:FAS1 domain-containing protein n=1 Tax=Nocardioides nanhaiensis TaxID=1476871 RepID=A0ABP8WCL0_9ACTN